VLFRSSSGPRRRGGARRFGPYLSRRRAASSRLSPLLSEASCRPTTSEGEACHEACCLVSDISASLAGGVQVEDIPSLGTIRTRGGCSYRGRGGTFNVGAPPPGAKARARNAPPCGQPYQSGDNPIRRRSTRPRCEGPGTTLPPNGQPYQRGSPPFDVGAPAPGAKGSGTKSPRRRPISLPD